MSVSAKVAIITRTKDRPLLLERAIKSVHNQSMKDFVHVIINDAGDKAVVDSLVEKHKKLIEGRVKVIHNNESHGMEAASNKAINSVDSTFIAIHDDDDTWHKDFLRRTTGHLESSEAKGVVVATDRVEEVIEGDSVRTLSTSRYFPELHAISLYRQCLDNQMTPITFLYRREVFKSIGMYDEALFVAGDWDFGIRFLQEYEVDFLGSYGALAYYHHRPTSVGVDANSVFDKKQLFETTLTRLRNKYLREDIKNGRAGIGYLLSTAHSAREAEERLYEEMKQYTVRIEGHVNYVADNQSAQVTNKITEEIQAQDVSLTHRLYRRFKDR